MAMTDYFKKNVCAKITQTKTANKHGNYTVSDAVGATFDGLLVKRSFAERNVGAKRGKDANAYNLYVYANAELAKNDKVRYTYNDGQVVYVRLTTNAILNDEFSGQTAWKTYEAETYEKAVMSNEQ